MTTMKQYRTIFDRALKLALNDLERCWEKDSTQAAPVHFEFELVVRLADGQEVRCKPVGHLQRGVNP